MALFRPGTIAAAISGTLGSVNFAITKNGPILRTAQISTDSKTDKQLARRARLPGTIAAWYDLTPTQRDVFSSMARSFSVQNALGLHHHLNGFQLYTMLDLNQVEPLTLPPGRLYQTAVIGIPYASTLTFTQGGPFTVRALPFPPPIAMVLKLWVSRPVTSRPIKHFKSWNLVAERITLDAPVDWYNFITPVIGEPKTGEIIGIRLAWHLSVVRQATPVTLKTVVL